MNNDFTKQYLIAALWSSIDTNTNESLANNYIVGDCSAETLNGAIDDCADFQAANASDLELAYATPGYDWDQAAHDFWFTRNHHRTGFWDRGLGEVGKRLTEAAHLYGAVDLYVGHDGKIYGA